MASSKKSSYKWRDNDVLTFLEYYKQIECLWDTNNVDYKDKRKRERAYELLKSNMGIKHLTVQDVKNKIKGIRTTYSEELNKILYSKKSEAQEIYEPKVFWFKKADSFLRRVTKARKSTSNLNYDMAETSEDRQSQNEESSGSYDVPVKSNTVEKHNKRIIQAQNKTLVIHAQNTVNAVDELTPRPPNIHRDHLYKEEDEFDLFGRSLAIQLKKLPELDALELMQKMQLMLNNKKQQLARQNRQITNKPFIKLSTTSPILASTPLPTYNYEMSPEQNMPSTPRFEATTLPISDPLSTNNYSYEQVLSSSAKASKDIHAREKYKESSD